jgi:hypothetical protein
MKKKMPSINEMGQFKQGYVNISEGLPVREVKPYNPPKHMRQDEIDFFLHTLKSKYAK